MADQEADPVRVRLVPPYPDPATLTGESEIVLELAGVQGEEVAEEILRVAREGRAEWRESLRRAPRPVHLSGTLEALERAPLEAGGAAAAVARAAGRLHRPPPPLRLGEGSWEFGRRTYLLGIVNVTPDSFSGDGVGERPGAALERARQLVREGADALDVGGESSRPGHRPVPAEREAARVVPAIRLIAEELAVPVFVDTSKAEVARAALRAGAAGVNDIWGLRRDPRMAQVVAEAGVPVICMHNQEGTAYRDLLEGIAEGLRGSLRLAREAGIPEEQVILDPGIGFGKDPRQNFEVLHRLLELRLLGRPLLVGTSRKSLIGWALHERGVEGRLLGTAATVAWSIARGADIVRVHDVGAMRDVARVTDLLCRRRPG